MHSFFSILLSPDVEIHSKLFVKTLKIASYGIEFALKRSEQGFMILCQSIQQKRLYTSRGFDLQEDAKEI